MRLFVFLLTITCLLVTACNPLQRRRQSDASRKSERELADIFLARLINDKADTIVQHRRVCIGCCEFYYFYWSLNEKRYYTEISENPYPIFPLAPRDTSIFNMIGRDYALLRESEVGIGTSYKDKDGSYNVVSPGIDHYCYFEINIYTQHGHLTSGRIIADSLTFHMKKDATSFQKIKNMDRSYEQYLRSPWFSLLAAINGQGPYQPDTSKQPIRTFVVEDSKP